MLACPSAIDEPCPIPAQCPYHLIFESRPPADAAALRTHEEIPRPFVIAPAWRPQNDSASAYAVGDELSFGLVLIGRAQEFFPHFVVTFREMDRLGRGRRAIGLARIKAADGCDETSGTTIYESHDNIVLGTGRALTFGDCARADIPVDSVTIKFLTQMRLKYEGSFARRPEFQILFRRLLGRLSSLARFHCGAPLKVDFRGLIDEAASIHLTHDHTEWTRWQRYSSRQERRMEWEGIVGEAVYEGDFTLFWQFLKFGEFVHVGHGATFGLGRYRLVSRAVDRNEEAN